MEDLSPLILLVAAVAAFLVGLSKGGLGGSAGALATPMLALVLPADRVIGLVLPILMLADIFAVALHWGHWNRKLVILLIPGSIAGVTIGTVLITNAPTETLQTLLGVIVLVVAIYLLFEKQIIGAMAYKSKDWHGLVAGTITGFSSALAHTGGPPVTIYLFMQKVTPRVFIATSALFFLILNWIKVPYYYYADLFDFDLLKQFVWILPLVPAGVFVGRWLIIRFKQSTFERIIVVLLIINALLLIFL